MIYRGGNGAGSVEVHEGGDVCTYIADSLGCTAESNTTLWSNYTPIKKNPNSYIASTLPNGHSFLPLKYAISSWLIYLIIFFPS